MITAALAEHVYGAPVDSGMSSFGSVLALLGLGVAALVLLVALVVVASRAPTVIIDNGGSGILGTVLFASLVIGVLFLVLAQNGGAT